MFKSLDESIRFNRSRFRLWREAVIRWATGIALAGAGFQAVYAMMFEFE